MTKMIIAEAEYEVLVIGDIANWYLENGLAPILDDIGEELGGDSGCNDEYYSNIRYIQNAPGDFSVEGDADYIQALMDTFAGLSADLQAEIRAYCE